MTHHARMLCVLLLALAAPVRAAEDAIRIRGLEPPIGVMRAVRFQPLHQSKLRADFSRAHLTLPVAGTLALERFHPFSATAEITGSAGPSEDRTWWIGRRADAPEQVAMVTADDAGVSGFVLAPDSPIVFGRVRGGVEHAAYRLADMAPGLWAPRAPTCGNDRRPDVGRVPRPAALPAARLPGPVLARLAVETDTELRARFSSDQQATDYLGTLVAAISAIYQRDVQVRLQIDWLRLWNAPDPWTATSTGAALDEVQAHWRQHLAAIERAAVHFVSGKNIGGGMAYVGTACSRDYGFGVSEVSGAFDLAVPDSIWDPLVVAHELGHNFGSHHSHCYVPPLDKCYNREAGCYDGPVVASRGTLMSYCHLLGGVENVDLWLGGAAATIRALADRAACLSPDGGATTTTTAAPTTTTATHASTTTAPTTTTAAPSTTTTVCPPCSTTTTQPCKPRFAPCATKAECCSRRCGWRARSFARVCKQ